MCQELCQPHYFDVTYSLEQKSKNATFHIFRYNFLSEDCNKKDIDVLGIYYSFWKFLNSLLYPLSVHIIPILKKALKLPCPFLLAMAGLSLY